MQRIRFSDLEILGVAAAAIGATMWIGDWLAGAAIVVLWIAFKLLVTGDGLLVLFLAIAFQWLQVTVGVFYVGVTGRQLMTTAASEYRPMVMLGLGCVLALTLGLRLGMMLVKLEDWHADDRPRLQLSWTALLVTYAVVLATQSTVIELSVAYPSIRQILLTVTVFRLGLLFLILRRLCRPLRIVPFAALVAIEIALGLTGFFQGFREPLIVALVALAEIFDRRSARHWATLAALVIGLAALSTLWMGIRGEYRGELAQMDALASESVRFERVHDLSAAWFDQDPSEMAGTVDNVVDRVWAVYYPALALARVPDVLPHTGGAILRAAIEHVLTPRVLFPDKPDLPSDSDMVRRYSGVFVAGRDEGTSIAFGYAIESYIDFGVPLMFVPVFVYGLLMGALYHLFLRIIWSGELAVAIVTLLFWLGLYLFERSWANTIGYTAGLVVYFALPMIGLDRLLLITFLGGRTVRTKTASLYPTFPDPPLSP